MESRTCMCVLCMCVLCNHVGYPLGCFVFNPQGYQGSLDMGICCHTHMYQHTYCNASSFKIVWCTFVHQRGLGLGPGSPG